MPHLTSEGSCSSPIIRLTKAIRVEIMPRFYERRSVQAAGAMAALPGGFKLAITDNGHGFKMDAPRIIAAATRLILVFDFQAR